MKTNLIAGLIGGVVVIGGGYYLLSQHPAAPTQQAETAASTPDTAAAPEQAGKYSGSFADLAARGGSWKCTIDTSTNQAISSGTAYVSSGKVRADFTSKISGYGSIESHMITDSEYAYTWSSMMPSGIKVKMTPQAGTGSAGAATGSGANVNSSYSYDCQVWTPDASLFAIPTAIKFTTAPGQ